MLNAAPTPAPASQDPRSWGPRRLPPSPPAHPAARSIEHNRSCVQPGQASCMPLKNRAGNWLVRRGRGQVIPLRASFGAMLRATPAIARLTRHDTQHRGHAFRLLLFRRIAQSGSAVAAIKLRDGCSFVVFVPRGHGNPPPVEWVAVIPESRQAPLRYPESTCSPLRVGPLPVTLL